MFQRRRISSRRVGIAGDARSLNEGLTGKTPSTNFQESTMKRILIAIAALVVATGAAQAGTRHATVTGPNGASATRTVQRGDGHVTDTTTGPNGNTRVRQVDRTRSQTTATITHANGGTSTRDTQRTATGSTTTVTGPQGRTGTISVTR